MPTLEIVMDFERLNKHLDVIQSRLPEARILTRSAFWIIVGCEVPDSLNEQEKAWLSAMMDARVIRLWRCKERTNR